MSKASLALGALLCIYASSCSDKPRAPENTAIPAQPAAATTSLPQKSPPCPVKLIHSRMVHTLDEDVYTTVVNVSDSDISAIALGAVHTDRFGKTWTPYKTELTSESTIKRGRSRTMHWEVLMEEPSIAQRKPDTSELYVTKVAFTDGHVQDTLGLDGCSFEF